MSHYCNNLFYPYRTETLKQSSKVFNKPQVPQLQMSCRGITRQSAVLYRLLTQTIEAPKKRNRTVKRDKHIKRKSGKGR